MEYVIYITNWAISLRHKCCHFDIACHHCKTANLPITKTKNKALQCHHNERDGVSNQRRLDCLLNCLIKWRSKKTWKLLITGLCEGNSPVTSESPHKGPVMWKMFPFDDIIMGLLTSQPLQPSQWHYNGCDGVTIDQPHDCLLNRLFRRRSKKTSKLRAIGLCERNSPMTGEFPAQRASNAEMFPFDDVIYDSCDSRVSQVSLVIADGLVPNKNFAFTKMV